LTLLANYLKDAPFFGGASPLTCDFVLYELLDQTSLLDSTNALANFPTLQAYVKRFAALPAIAAYLKSPTFITRPVNNGVASWK